MARLRGKRWQANVQLPDGKRLRPTFATEAEALAWESAARLAIERGTALPAFRDPHPEPERTEPEKEATGLQLLGPLYDHVCRTEWADMRASVALQRNGKHVVDYFGRDKRVDRIASADAAEMRVHFSGQGLSAATVNRKTAALSKLLKVAKDNGIVVATPRLRWNKVEQIPATSARRTSSCVGGGRSGRTRTLPPAALRRKMVADDRARAAVSGRPVLGDRAQGRRRSGDTSGTSQGIETEADRAAPEPAAGNDRFQLA